MRKTLLKTLVVALLVVVAGPCSVAPMFGQSTPSPSAGAGAVVQKPVPAAPAPQTSPTTTAVDAKKPVELQLTNADCTFFNKRIGQLVPRGYCRLGDTIVLTFANLSDWQNDPNAKGNDPASLMLVLNGRVIKGIAARGPQVGAQVPGTGGAQAAANPQSADQLLFDLKYLDLVEDDKDTTDNRTAWSALFGRTKGSIRLLVGVAPGGKAPYLGAVPVTFQVLSPGEAWFAIAIFAFLLITFFLLAHLTDILRDGPSAKGAPKMTYSLARCQMAWWFFLVVGAFLYIWLVIGDRDSLTPGVLTLIGISAATGFGSFLVDSSKSDQRKALLSQQSDLTTRLNALQALQGALSADQAADLQQKQKQLSDVNASLAALPSPVGESSGLIVDILRDESGVSFHRFQMVAWTIILGFIYIVAVYKTLAMPDFSATLLGLMGISAGTYIGFKIPNPPKDPTAANPS
jgi:hypothetical protein